MSINILENWSFPPNYSIKLVIVTLKKIQHLYKIVRFFKNGRWLLNWMQVRILIFSRNSLSLIESYFKLVYSKSQTRCKEKAEEVKREIAMLIQILEDSKQTVAETLAQNEQDLEEQRREIEEIEHKDQELMRLMAELKSKPSLENDF